MNPRCFGGLVIYVHMFIKVQPCFLNETIRNGFEQRADIGIDLMSQDISLTQWGKTIEL